MVGIERIKVIEARTAKFLKDFDNNGSNSQNVVIKKTQELLSEPTFGGNIELGGQMPIMIQQLSIQSSPTPKVITELVIQEP